jgi:tetratricopeptide (TPR) repeat protein
VRAEPARSGSSPARRGRRAAWLAVAALVGATLLAHSPVLDAGFVGYDDTAYVQKNEHVAHGLRLADVRWALTGYEQSNWHPLTWISHMLDVELFGFEPRGPHAVNLALHVLNVVALFLVLRSLTGDPWPSLLVAAVFALHPANVESVAWIAQRKTLLCTLFMILSTGAYAAWARGGGRRAYAASLGCFVLAMTSKPMIVTFPFTLLLLDYWPLRRAELEPAPGTRATLAGVARGVLRLTPEKLPFLALSALHALVTLDAQRDAMSTLDNYPVAQRLGNVAVSYVGYLGTYFAPRNLAVFYPLYPERLTPALVLACAALLAALTAASVRLGLRRRYLLVGWLWYVGTLVPVIGLVQVGMQSMADRYVYVPFWGLSIAIAWSLRDALRALPRARALRAATAAVLGAALVVFGALTFRQSRHWRGPFELFGSAIENTAGNYLAHSVLAERYYAEGEFEKCIEHSREAVKSRRNMGPVRSTYGLALYALGRRDEALEQFKLAAAQEEDNPIGYMNLGWFENERGNHAQAIRDLENAAGRISRKTIPYTRKMIYANWGQALAGSGKLEGAREKYALALEVDPDDAAFLRDAARIDLRLRDVDAARGRLRRALEADGDGGAAAFLLASAALLAGEESGALFAEAHERAPGEAAVVVDLARTLAGDGRPDDAERLLGALLALEPPADPAEAGRIAALVHAQLGEIAVQRGDLGRARAELERALGADPDHFDANQRLAFLLATSADPALRDPARAVALAERAAAERREYAPLATLSTAYAAAGRVREAAAIAREALELARRAGDARAVAALEHQLAVFTAMVAEAGAASR